MERERATVEDRCSGHTDGTDLVYGLTGHIFRLMTVMLFLTYSFKDHLHTYERIMYLEWCF